MVALAANLVHPSLTNYGRLPRPQFLWIADEVTTIRQAPDGRFWVDGGPSSRGWHFYESMLQCPRKWAEAHLSDETGVGLEEAARLFSLYGDAFGLVEEEEEADGVSSAPERSAFPLMRGILLHVGVGQYLRRLQVYQEAGSPHVEAWLSPFEAMDEYARLHPAVFAPISQRFRKLGDPAVWTFDTILPMCRTAVSAFMEWWTAARSKWQVVAVEVEVGRWVERWPAAMAAARQVDDAENVRRGLVTPDGRHFLVTQRLDVVAVDRDGYGHLDDSKTSGRADPKSDDAYTASGQILGLYRLGSMLYGAGGKLGGVQLLYSVFTEKAGEPVSVKIRPFVPPVRINALQGLDETLRWADYQIALFRSSGLVEPGQFPQVSVGQGICRGLWGRCPFWERCGR